MPEVRNYKENFFKAELPKKSTQGLFSSVNYVKDFLWA